MIIPGKEYERLVTILPILCVDVIIRIPDGRYLLVRRRNEPMKGKWWVIGGRVFKGESLEQAVKRKVKEEIGLEISGAEAVGYFEDVSGVNPFGSKEPYHSISVVFLTEMEDGREVTLDSQSSEWKYARKLPACFLVKPFSPGSGISRRKTGTAGGK